MGPSGGLLFETLLLDPWIERSTRNNGSRRTNLTLAAGKRLFNKLRELRQRHIRAGNPLCHFKLALYITTDRQRAFFLKPPRAKQEL